MKKILMTLTILTILVPFTSGVLPAKQTKVKIMITPEKAVYSTPFVITISGLVPNEEVKIKASATDKMGVIWESAATFKADNSGGIDLVNQAPIRGSYLKKDKLGLLWSMLPVNSKRKLTYFSYDTDKGLVIAFTLTDSKGTTITKILLRFYEDPGDKLSRIKLDENGLKGTLYSPNTGKRYPAVILLGGASGGSVDWLAKAIACHGFSVLDIPYFKYPGLPKNLVNIPIEYFEKAIQWVKNQKSVKKGKIGLVGGSRGAELALLLASMFDEFKVIVGWVPAAHLWQGEDYTKLVPSWTFNGKPLPYLGEVMSKEELNKLFSGKITSFREYFLNSLKNLDGSLIRKAAIKVENIKAPILLISGKDDQTWPSAEFSEMIVKRLKKHNFKYQYTHLAAENAGHLVFLPDFITATYRHFNGGSRESELHQSIRSWQKTIKFLHKYLDN